ncbi:hypothetical protein TrLO_g5613 [Triparma laevis f. longispina]|uniref:Autophagy-related protein n=1 Tax=Triparma laevis f. longispina TaxID=1714387 RepID=A0A9W7CG24_9STRA|nr:hypothetical protein TrLO_g5613 [Triparma laevis f. longispina]
MPLGAAKAAVGRKTKKELQEELEKKREAMSEQLLKNRMEFDLNEDKVSAYELASWYGFDWANSVYSSVVISMFLPVLMFYLADGFACPYTFLPVNPNATEDSNSLDWNGHKNESTTCLVNPEYPLQVFGGAPGGLEYYPASNIIYYDQLLDKFYVDDEYFWGDPDVSQISCADTPGDIGFGMVRNSSGWSSGCVEGNDLKTEKCDAKLAGSSGPPTSGYSTYTVPLDTSVDLTGGVTISFNSSNAFIVEHGTCSTDSEDVPTGGCGTVEIDGTNLKIGLLPKLMAVGSTTLEVTVTSIADTSKTGVFGFTFNAFMHPDCPYRVKFGYISIRPVTYTATVLSLSVLGQAAAYFSVASFGDFGPFRKLLLCYSSLVGCIACMAFITCTRNEHYLRAGWLTIVSNIFFGTAYLFYNAYLPYLTRSHPIFLEAKFEYKNIKTGAATGVGAASKKLLSTYHDTCDMISAEGFFWGYVSGAGCCFASIGLIMVYGGLDGVRLIIFLMGCWWFIFAMPMFFLLHTRPGPNFPADLKGNPLLMITFSWRRIVASAYAMRNLPETRRFLIAYFFFSDGINTIANVAILFAMQDLGMNTVELTILAAEAPMFGAIGVKLFRRHQVKHGLSSKEMLMRGIYMLVAVPIYGAIGYIAELGWWANCPIGIVQKTEMYFVCIIFGITLGPTQSYARTFFTDLIPPGQEAEYFGIFEVSDRGSSWVGPLFIAILYENTGVIRHAMWYLLAVIIWGGYLVWTTDEYKGSDDCRRKEILVRMVADRKKFGIHKSGAPPSAKRMAGLKSSKLYTGQSGYSSAASGRSVQSSTASSASSVEKSERSNKFSVFNKNKVKPADDFGGQTVVEGEEDKAGGGFNNETVIEQEDGGGFNNETVIEQEDGGDFNNETVIEQDDDDNKFGTETVIEQTDDDNKFGTETVIEQTE